jgi:RNA polymerase sigma factor (sigma-70 family)
MISVLTFVSTADAPMAHTDASAVRAWVKDGDESAAGWLFDKYLPLVVHICSRRLPRHWMISDAAQDTMSRAFLSLANFDTGRCFSSWIATIASHVCSDHLREFARKVDFPARCPIEEAREIAAADRTFRVSIARELLDGLEPVSREIVEAHYLEGLTAREVAGRAGLSPENVAIRLMRARQTMASRASKLGIQS